MVGRNRDRPPGRGEQRSWLWSDLTAGRPTRLAIGAYLLLAAPVLVLPDRPPAWAALLAAHLLGGLFLLHWPARRRLQRWSARRWPRTARIAAAWYPFVLVPALYAEIPLLNRAVHAGRYFDGVAIGWDQAWFGGQPSRELAAALPWLPLSELLHAAYLSYYGIIWVPALVLYLRGEMRGFRTAVLLFVLASVVPYLAFVYFPVQGPRYLFPAPTAGAIDAGWLYGLTHRVLENGSSRGSAFPSGHVAVSIAQAAVCLRFLPRSAPWVVALVALLSVATVYGGFHYLIDALVGAVVGLAVAAVGAWAHREAPTPTH